LARYPLEPVKESVDAPPGGRRLVSKIRLAPHPFDDIAGGTTATVAPSAWKQQFRVDVGLAVRLGLEAQVSRPGGVVIGGGLRGMGDNLGSIRAAPYEARMGKPVDHAPYQL